VVAGRTGAVRRDLGPAIGVLTSTDRAMAWLRGPCSVEGECRPMVTDLRTGHAASYRSPLNRTPTAAAFAPAGRRLALGVSGLHEFIPGAVPPP